MNFNVYSRPNKPKFIEVKDRREKDINVNTLKLCFEGVPEPLQVHASTECHVTPSNVASQMVDYLECNHVHTVLEPHAGTGALVGAVLHDGIVSAGNITAVERDYSLFEALSGCAQFDGVSLNHECFLSFSDEYQGTFDRIILNPPFKKIKAHMSAAISLLAKDGVLVALVPITYNHDNAVTLVELDNDTFANAKVFTKIIRIEK